MRWLFVLVAFAGCGFQPRAARTADASGGLDAASDAADATLDTQLDAPSNTDTDADGVPDAIDNCPAIANPDQRDHDVDGRGDVCDLCPHITEAADLDTDGDGVGDACDPRPSMAGDRRALWVGFYDANDIAGWPTNATPTITAGRVNLGSTTGALQIVYPPITFTNAYATTSARITAVGTPSMTSAPAIELYTGHNGVNTYYVCYVAQTTASLAAYAVDIWPGQAGQAATLPWTGTFAAQSDLVLTDTVAGTTHDCKIAQGAVVAAPTQTAGPHAGFVILGAQDATAGFDYLFVVEAGQ